VETQLRNLSNETNWAGGHLLNIHIAPTASVAMEEVAAANFVSGRGIEGDRYFLGTGTYSAKGDFRDITLFEIEVLEAFARNDPPLQSSPIKLRPADHRRNLTVRGVPLNHLVGKRFRVGEAILSGGRLNFPCRYLEKLVGLPLICSCTTDRVSIAGSRRAAPFKAAIRSN